MTELSIPVDGMSCAACAGRVERALGAVPGVSRAVVNLAGETAHVSFDAPADTQGLTDALQKAGYPARQAETVLEIEGMSCASCVGRVEKALAAVHGVAEARVNLANETATVLHVEGLAPATLIAASTAAGYSASPRTAEAAPVTDRKAAEAEVLRRRLLLAAALSLPVFVAEMGGHLYPPLHHWIMATLGTTPFRVAQFVLTTLVLAGPGRMFYTKGLPALLRGAPEMNALVAVGTLAAWGYSTVATFAPAVLPEDARDVYFESAAVIVTLILFGRWLEARAKGRTGEAIRRLVALRPRTARVEREGVARDVPLDALRPDDILIVRPGETVPTDGIVLSGASHLDESMITGEPLPVARSAGDEVTGGTMNRDGALRVQAIRVGGDTVLAQVIRMVEQAQATKLPIQSLVDRITGWFVPVVMLLATLTFLVWLALGPSLGHALVAGVAVLIIACPCAMGLAVPTSIVVGSGRAAALGVLFRRGDALQALRGVGTVAMDKTGTLTEGHPVLTDLIAAEGIDADRVLALAAAAEAQSEHPLARAITAGAEARGLTLPLADQVTAEPGFGLLALVDGHELRIGTERLMKREGIALGPLSERARKLAARGHGVLFVAIDGMPGAVIGVSDPVRATTPAALDALRREGLRIVMLTGDGESTARAIAGELGITEVRAGLLPQDKQRILRELREDFGPVAFVGDGINDAPALAEAEVGIAIGTGTDVAVESADVVLISGDLRGVAQAVGLSRAVMRNIHENLFWAFGYNVLLIPVAAGALYPAFGIMLSPMLGAGAMALSSVFVLGNALRLRLAGTPAAEPAPVGGPAPLPAPAE